MSTINQKEYLKKYLSIGAEPGKKKKKKKKVIKSDKLRIIDDDEDIKHFTKAIQEDLLGNEEDAPQIVGYVDDRPLELKLQDYKSTGLWKPAITNDNDVLIYDDPSIIRSRSSENMLLKDIKEEIVSPQISPDRNVSNSHDDSPHRSNLGDISVHRRRDNHDEDDMSPLRRRHESNSLADRNKSPPAQQTDSDSCTNNMKFSFKIKREKMSPSREDLSPPRKQSRQNVSPPRRYKQSECKDLSPERRRSREFNSQHNSNSQKQRDTDDISPPRKKKQHYSSSPPRRHSKKHRDLTPPRRANNIDKPCASTTEKSIDDETEIIKDKVAKLAKTLDGKRAGLQNAAELVKENQAFKQRENELFNSMSAQVSGANAAPIMRDKRTGRKRNLEEEAEKEREKQAKEAKHKEKYTRWGKGLKQVEDYNEKLKQDVYEMSKPLARYADDEDLEAYLKEQEREGDPMLAYIRKKRKKERIEAGEPGKPQYEGEFMPNRYGIKPGHRWDGVNRSNGYEQKWFEVQNAKKAGQEDVYKWSTEDM